MKPYLSVLPFLSVGLFYFDFFENVIITYKHYFFKKYQGHHDMALA